MHKRADLLRWSQTRLNIWTNTLQARNQFSRFGGVQYIFRGMIFAFTICLKQIFLDTTKFGGAQKKFRGALPPNAPRGYGPDTLYNRDGFEKLHSTKILNTVICSPKTVAEVAKKFKTILSNPYLAEVHGVWNFWLRLHSCFGWIYSDSTRTPKHFKVLESDSSLNSNMNAINVWQCLNDRIRFSLWKD